MEFLSYFFRSEPDGVYFQNYGPSHLMIILITFLGVCFIYHKQRQLRLAKHNLLIKRILAIILLAQQGILYLWYVYTGYSSIKESLPLYNCRIAIIATALGLTTNKNIFKNISVYWGLYGGILALSVVQGDPFSFPHYTRISFFIGHIFLVWGTFFILLVEKYRLTKESLKSIISYTTIYHLLLLIFNLLIGANYDYLISPPILKDMASKLPQLTYSLIAVLLFNLFIVVFHYIVIGIYNNKNKRQIELVSFSEL